MAALPRGHTELPTASADTQAQPDAWPILRRGRGAKGSCNEDMCEYQFRFTSAKMHLAEPTVE